MTLTEPTVTALIVCKALP